MKIIITGGGGYIGSHTAVEALRSGHEVLVIDSFVNSFRDVLDNIRKASGKDFKSIEICMSEDPSFLSKIIYNLFGDADAIIHFAALKNSPGSTQIPIEYYRNNLVSLINAIEISSLLSIKNFIFSSSATVYGDPEELPIKETNKTSRGKTPYGSSKIMGEWILEDATKVKEIKSISLRYFNPAGADKSGFIGENPIGIAANLVPIITQCASGFYKGNVKVTGTDFPTPDGSAIRDYIHVSDLAKAHLSALDWMKDKEIHTYETFNIGRGKGTSVLEMLDIFEKKIQPGLIKFELSERREGDPGEVWCDPSKAQRILGWRSELDNIDILKSSWEWEKKIRGIG